MPNDIALNIEDALTDDEKQSILDRWARLNPHQIGAHVADILDMLVGVDSDLELVEAHYERWGRHASPELGWCVRALIWASDGRDPTEAEILHLMERVKKARSRS